MKVKEAIQRLAGFNLEAELLLEKSEKVICFTKDVEYFLQKTPNVYIITTKKEEKPKPLVSKWRWVYYEKFNGQGFYRITEDHYSEKEITTYLHNQNCSSPERIHSSHIIKEET